jgi:hypothetical protein
LIHNRITPTSKAHGRKGGVRVSLVWALGLVLGLCLTAPATAKLVKDKSARDDAPRQVFGEITEAWEAADEQALAALIGTEGLRVTNSQAGERVSHYSPSQAYYYFRNVFQSHRTLLFEFEMMQDATAGARVHGVATWKRRRPDSEVIQIVKLVCILVRQDDGWKLAEINTIR